MLLYKLRTNTAVLRDVLCMQNGELSHESAIVVHHLLRLYLQEVIFCCTETGWTEQTTDTSLFVPQTILTFLAADEGRKF